MIQWLEYEIAFPLKRNQNKWEIVWVGEQYKCQPNRGHQDWSGSVCS